MSAGVHVLGVVETIPINKVILPHGDCSTRRVTEVGVEIAVLLRGAQVSSGTAAPFEIYFFLSGWVVPHALGHFEYKVKPRAEDWT